MARIICAMRDKWGPKPTRRVTVREAPLSTGILYQRWCARRGGAARATPRTGDELARVDGAKDMTGSHAAVVFYPN